MKSDLSNKNASCRKDSASNNITLEESAQWPDYPVPKSCHRQDVMSAQELLQHLMEQEGNEKLHGKKNGWTSKAIKSKLITTFWWEELLRDKTIRMDLSRATAHLPFQNMHFSKASIIGLAVTVTGWVLHPAYKRGYPNTYMPFLASESIWSKRLWWPPAVCIYFELLLWIKDIDTTEKMDWKNLQAIFILKILTRFGQRWNH